MLAVMAWQLCDSSLFSLTNIIPSALSHKGLQVKCAHGKVQFTQATALMVHGYCRLRFVNQLPGYSAWSMQEVNGLLNASCNVICHIKMYTWVTPWLRTPAGQVLSIVPTPEWPCCLYTSAVAPDAASCSRLEGLAMLQ